MFFTRRDIPHIFEPMDFKIAVVIPVYNAAPFLEMAVTSAIVLEDVEEIILVEDGSADGSLEICKRLSKNAGKIKLFTHPSNKNLGPSASRNLGIARSTSPFIAFLDADDIYLPHRFHSAKAIFTNQPETEGVYEAIGTMPGENAANKPILTTVHKVFTSEKLFYGISPVGNQGYFHISGLSLRREVFTRLGNFNENLAIGEDTEFFLRLTAAAFLSPGDIIAPVARRRIHLNNCSTDETRMRIHKPLMALESLKWFRDHQMPFRMCEEILRVYLKYRYELDAAQKTSNRINQKFTQIRDALRLWFGFPALRKSKYLQYHLRLTFKLPVKKHMDFYAQS